MWFNFEKFSKYPKKNKKNNLFYRVDGEDVRLMLWDTAGQEEFDAITAAYYRGAHACVLAYSATDRDSFDAIPSWKQKVRLSCTRDIHTMLNRCKHVSVGSHDGWWNVKVKVPLKQGADFKSLHDWIFLQVATHRS